jgi:hypothetical protein
MRFEKTILLASSASSSNGVLHVYRFTNPSPDPENRLEVRLGLTGALIELPIPR